MPMSHKKVDRLLFRSVTEKNSDKIEELRLMSTTEYHFGAGPFGVGVSVGAVHGLRERAHYFNLIETA